MNKYARPDIHTGTSKQYTGVLPEVLVVLEVLVLVCTFGSLHLENCLGVLGVLEALVVLGVPGALGDPHG